MSGTATSEDVLAGRAPWAVVADDCIRGMETLPDGCVHVCVTSPPYYALRDYGHDGQIGLEDTPEAYVAKMVEVFRGVRRILHDTGTLWLNLGDSYAGSWGNYGGQNRGNGTQRPIVTGSRAPNRAYDGLDHKRPATTNPPGCKPKDLIGIPWMVAFALRADGWYLRQWCPWVKRNSMPESATDRPSTSCETVFILAKRPDYFFDMEAVKRTAAQPAGEPELTGQHKRAQLQRLNASTLGTNQGADTRNFRSADLWFDSVGLMLSGEGDALGFDVPLKSYKGAHFATFPTNLVEPCVLAGTSAKGVCPACGSPWVRQVKKVRKATRPGTGSKVTGDTLTDGNRDPERHVTATETVGWAAGCKCAAGEAVPAVVFDPFTGSGTTLAVAVDNGRRALGTELNPDYLPLIRARMARVNPPLFSEDAA